MIYAKETYDQVINDMKPLMYEHYHEIAKYQDIPLEPDWEAYKAMETLGILNVFTCRDTETKELLGYGVYLVKKHLHYQSCLVAQQDILFITKEKRGQGGRFILWCDEQLRANGVNMVVHHVKATHNFGPMLERLGYELMDLIYTRRI